MWLLTRLLSSCSVTRCCNRQVATVAAGRQSVVCVSAHTGEGVAELLLTIEEQLKASMEYVQVLIPFSKASPPTSCHPLSLCLAEACQLRQRMPPGWMFCLPLLSA